MATKKKFYNIVIRETIDYPVRIEATTGKEAKAIAETIKINDKKTIRNKEIISERKYRTERQNKALHLWLGWYAKELQEKGVTVREIIDYSQKRGYEMFPTLNFLKEYVWKRIQKKAFGYKSTTKLDRHEEIKQVQMYFEKLMIDIGDIEPIIWPDKQIKYYEQYEAKKQKNI